MEEWSEWQDLEGRFLSCEVSFAFPYDWDIHETEYRLKDGSIVSGQVWAGEEPFTKEWAGRCHPLGWRRNAHENTLGTLLRFHDEK